ncbi:hypothetical protein EYF80_015364 [Liparis tanakae]|uniref:Uncharacterized protein n=1 Tax=Liparis tanakae TaxID=230148 RepID=A0A4Z2IAH3_9TELE|nr:hypothetical protein EYF80_015364 [Liparis tanakae]
MDGSDLTLASRHTPQLTELQAVLYNMEAVRWIPDKQLHRYVGVLAGAKVAGVVLGVEWEGTEVAECRVSAKHLLPCPDICTLDGRRDCLPVVGVKCPTSIMITAYTESLS